MSSRRRLCLLIFAFAVNAVVGQELTTDSLSSSECLYSGRYPECSCISGSRGGFMLQCQVEEDYFSVDVFPKDDLSVSLKIDCPCNTSSGPPQTPIFDYLSELKLGPVSILHMTGCPLEQWSFSRWIDPAKLQDLKLRSCQPLKDSLNPTFFRNLTQLNWLYLSSNSLTDLPEGLFRDLANLKQLWLNDNQLDAIKQSHYRDLINLRLLQLGSNKIKTVEDGSFKNLQGLVQLNLESNQIAKFPGSLLQPLANLTILDLSNNQISNLEKEFTKSNPELTQLGLRNNLFRSLPAGIFQSNLKLKKLYLQGNTELSNLSGDLFGNVASSLEDLDLGSCNITTLNPNWFTSFGNLESLDLTGNRLSSLTSGSFANLRKLVTLKLMRNKLAFLESGAFRGLSSLKKLVLRNNLLSAIPPDVLYPLTELEVIDLGRNQLSFSEMEAGLFYEGQSPLQNNLKLKSIDLSGNQITHIFSDWGNMNFLTELNLSYNNLTALNFEDLATLTPGIQLDVRSNLIRRINFNSALHLDQVPSSDDKQVKRNGTPRKTVYLDGNPLLCDCLTFNLVRYMNRTLPGVQHSWDIEAPSISCQEPESLRHLPPISVDPRLFVCPCMETVDDGSLCTCNKRPLDKVILQDCRPFNKTSIPAVNIPGYELHLKLSADQMSSLNNLTNGPSIVSLDLSWNEMNSSIFESDWWNRSSELFPNLKRLDLSYNLLRSIPARVIHVWNEARQLALLLSGNQWDCDCFNRHLLELPFGLRTRIEDYDRMTCANGLSLPPPEVACPNVALRSVIVIVPLMAIVILFVFAVTFRFRKELRVWMYNRNICLWCVTKKEADEDSERLYDAFISFSHKDEDFVVQQLVPQLELPESGEPAFRLCLHYRDWLAGERIPDQVSRSVAGSKRTIVILSEHFLDSMWGQLEFRTAYQQVLTDRCMRLIVIVMGDLPPKEKMDDELKSYLSLNTYLKWGDPWFWERLRYALPHKKNTRNIVENGNHRPAGSRLSQAIIEHGGDLQQPEGLKIKEPIQMNGAKLNNHLGPLPLLADRTEHRAHIILPPDIEMSLTPTSSASSTAPIFPTSY